MKATDDVAAPMTHSVTTGMTGTTTEVTRRVPRIDPLTGIEALKRSTSSAEDTKLIREAMERGRPGGRMWIEKDEVSMQRKYLPTFAELIDRLSIVLLKAVFIPEHHDDYMAEIALIEHDLDLLLAQMLAKSNGEAAILGGREVRAILVLMLSNRFIWENEGKARAGGGEQDRLLKLTHSINGVRNRAKNVLAEFTGERKDHKVDTLAADIVSGAGMNWDIV